MNIDIYIIVQFSHKLSVVNPKELRVSSLSYCWTKSFGKAFIMYGAESVVEEH